MDKRTDPIRIFAEYERGVQYKTALGARGLYEQSRVNERFMIGDQWHGARCGNSRPLVRHNIIKRIGDYKMAAVGAAPVAVTYAADGVPDTLAVKDRVAALRADFLRGDAPAIDATDEVPLVMSALTDYFRTTAERLRFESLRFEVLRAAYVTGTGVLYTYWDDTVQTGLYADDAKAVPITGDIACEVIDIDNVTFGDPTETDIEAQPYILLVQRLAVEDIHRRMKAHGRPAADIEAVKPDPTLGEEDRALLITKLYRDEDGIHAVQVCRGVTVRNGWALGVRRYPLTVFCWEPRSHSAYGESEITYLIPNQIAINRMLTASVWAVMMMGMPTLLVNGDTVRQPLTNEPGQTVRIFGGAAEMQNALRYVDPPQFAPALDGNIRSLIDTTLTQSGANEAALGDLRPDNTSAIVAVREAAMMPLQTIRNRFYAFIEDTARVWAEFWVSRYGARRLKIEESGGTWYLPFDGRRYRDLVVSARVDVGASTLHDESESIRTLDHLLERGVIDAVQYLRRLPKGTVPEVSTLIRELEGVGV